jgi:hypothetical protein
LNPHGTPGQTPERHALDQAEVRDRVRLAVIASQRIGNTRAAFVACVESEWSRVEKMQTDAATEAGKHAERRRGPRRQKAVR